MNTDKQKFIVSEGWFNQIGADDVVIYHCEFDKEQYKDSLFGEMGVDYSDTLHRAVDKRKAEFLAGRYCAKNALAELNVHNFRVVPDKNRCPLWPKDIKGTITHSNHNALVALSSDTSILGIGIDIESVMTDKTMGDVKDAIVKGNENRFLDLPDASAGTIVSLIFSIKESFFKAAYPSTGYYFDFDAVTVDVLDFAENRFTLTVVQNLNPKLTPGMVFSGQFAFFDEQVLSLLILP